MERDARPGRKEVERPDGPNGQPMAGREVADELAKWSPLGVESRRKQSPYNNCQCIVAAALTNGLFTLATKRGSQSS
jgi:hypothetical protein